MDTPKFIDGENYTPGGSNKDDISFRDIVMQHLRKISNFYSCEFKGGYWETRENIVQGAIITSKVYIPDTREIFSNSIECLSDMLFPHFDEEMQSDNDISRNKLKALQKNEELPPQDKKQFVGVDDRTTYRDFRVEISKEWFRNLNRFLKRNNYLQLGELDE